MQIKVYKPLLLLLFSVHSSISFAAISVYLFSGNFFLCLFGIFAQPSEALSAVLHLLGEW